MQTNLNWVVKFQVVRQKMWSFKSGDIQLVRLFLDKNDCDPRRLNTLNWFDGKLSTNEKF